MIVLVTGSPGAGKSFALTRAIVQGVESGKVVATNVPLRDDWAIQLVRSNVFRRLRGRAYCHHKAREYERRVFVSDDFEQLLRVRLRGDKEARGLLVLDEVHRWANSRTWDADESGEELTKTEAVARRLELVKWFSAHRHYGWDVWLGTQTEETIDRQIRKLYEYVLICRNLRRFRVVGVPLSPVNFFLVLWCWNDKARTIMRRQVYPLKKRIASLYATHALHSIDFPAVPIWLPADGDVSEPPPLASGSGREDGRQADPAAPPPRPPLPPPASPATSR